MSPKERFQEDKPAVKQLSDLAENAAFLRACDMAMLQVAESIPILNDPQAAAANAYRLEGARIFQRTLLTLADKPEVKETRSRQLTPTT
jgi:hypothetical protein